MDEMINEVSL